MINYANLKPIDFKFKSISVQPCIMDDDGVDVCICTREEAEFWGVYFTLLNGEKRWVIDFSTSLQALRFVKFILSVLQNYTPDENL